MSNKKLSPDDLEDKNAVVITPDDCAECEKFFQFFEIEIPPGLKAAFDAFQKNPSYQNQCEFKFQLADALAASEHPVFKDEVFDQVRPEVSAARDELAFERELEATLASTEE